MPTTRKRPIKYRRGKPIPALRHGDRIDLTTFPLGSMPLGDGRRIARCEKCGRKGERSTYAGIKHRTAHYTHLTEFQTFFWFVRDSCTVQLED